MLPNDATELLLKFCFANDTFRVRDHKWSIVLPQWNYYAKCLNSAPLYTVTACSLLA